MADDSVEPVARLLYRVSEAALALGLSKAKVYELINSGALYAVRIDGARRIKAADLEPSWPRSVRMPPDGSQTSARKRRRRCLPARE